MVEHAGIWQRVSSGGQDEANQLPDLLKWCDSHGYTYELDGPAHYVLHGKSASKGKHQAQLDRVVRDMEDGRITVLVVWQSSRIERRGAFNAFDLARRVKNAGGRIEYVKDSYLNDVNEMSDVMLALAASKDRQKSRDISVQVTAAQEANRAKGSVNGRAPWGYRIECAVCHRRPERPHCNTHIKILVPTDIGRKYIPLIFQAAINRETCREIAAWLDSEGVKSNSGKPWNEGTICNDLIKNPVYYGARRNAGALKTEALVTPTVWHAANAALASRARPGRSAAKREKALLAPICGKCHGVVRDGCPSGRSPMYRLRSKDGKDYYRCAGHGPQRKGCGSMIPIAALDAAVTESMLANEAWHFNRVFVPGDNRSDEVTRLRERGAEAMRQGDYQAATEAMQEAGQLEALPRVPAHWEGVNTGQTEAQYFASLAPAARREYLSRHEIVASEDESGIVLAIEPREVARLTA